MLAKTGIERHMFTPQANIQAALKTSGRIIDEFSRGTTNLHNQTEKKLAR
jgi:hypothetical protein